MNVSTMHCWAGNATLGLRLCVLLTGWQKLAILYCFQITLAEPCQFCLPHESAIYAFLCLKGSKGTKQKTCIHENFLMPLRQRKWWEKNTGEGNVCYCWQGMAYITEWNLTFYVIFYIKTFFWQPQERFRFVLYGRIRYKTILVESLTHSLLKRLESLSSRCWKQGILL